MVSNRSAVPASVGRGSGQGGRTFTGMRGLLVDAPLGATPGRSTLQHHTKTLGAVAATLYGQCRAARSFTAGRICGAGACGTKLSIYNDGYFCSLHAPSKVTRNRVRA